MEENGAPSFPIASSSPLKSIAELEQPHMHSSDGSSTEGTLPVSEDSNISDSKSDLLRIERANTVDRLANLAEQKQSNRTKTAAKLPSVSVVALLFTPLKRTPIKEEDSSP
jgi:hypothetical protein